MKLKKKNNIFGFTLTELLASILVLTIICSITIYTAVNVVKSSKEKSYQVTKNGSTVNNVKSIKIEGTKLQDEIELAEDKDVLFKINKNADTKTYVNDKEVEYASVNDKVKVVVNPKENTYVKNIIVTNKADSKVEVALNENKWKIFESFNTL